MTVHSEPDGWPHQGRIGRGAVRRRLVVATCLVSLMAGGCRADGEPASQDRPAAPDEEVACDQERSQELVEGEQTLRFGGETRAFLLSLPEGDVATPRPLLLSFHGYSFNKEIHEGYTGLAEEATARGYIVVTPGALGEPSDWNYLADPARVDDFAFVRALVDKLTRSLCIDEDRIFVAGHSAGSALAGFLVCREPGRYAAAAMVAAFIPPSCPTGDPPPSAIAIHGTADPLVPFEGGNVSGGPVQIPAALDTLAAYADASGCGPAAVEELLPRVERHHLTDCGRGRQVELYVIDYGGHEWPGADPPQTDDPSGLLATDVILDFFDGLPPQA